MADDEPPVDTSFTTCDARTELRIANAAGTLLSRAHPSDAIAILNTYQRRCPSGHWSDLAWRVRLESLCALHKNAEAVSLMQWFSAEYPARRAALAAELSDRCSEEVRRRGFTPPR